MASLALASEPLIAGRIEIPFAVLIARDGLAADAEPAEAAGLALAEAVHLVRQRVRGVVGVDHQHLGAVACGGQRDVQRGDAAILAGAGADHGHDRHRVGRRALGQRSRASRAWR